MSKCAVEGCENYTRGIRKKKSFFRIPKKPSSRARWLKAINKPGFVPTRNTVVCEDHFAESDIYTICGVKRLNSDPMPSGSRKKSSTEVASSVSEETKDNNEENLGQQLTSEYLEDSNLNEPVSVEYLKYEDSSTGSVDSIEIKNEPVVENSASPTVYDNITSPNVDNIIQSIKTEPVSTTLQDFDNIIQSIKIEPVSTTLQDFEDVIPRIITLYPRSYKKPNNVISNTDNVAENVKKNPIAVQRNASPQGQPLSEMEMLQRVLVKCVPTSGGMAKQIESPKDFTTKESLPTIAHVISADSVIDILNKRVEQQKKEITLPHNNESRNNNIVIPTIPYISPVNRILDIINKSIDQQKKVPVPTLKPILAQNNEVTKQSVSTAAHVTSAQSILDMINKRIDKQNKEPLPMLESICSQNKDKAKQIITKAALPIITNSPTTQNIVNINNKLIKHENQQLTPPIGSNLLINESSKQDMTKVNLPTTTVHSIPAQSILNSNNDKTKQIITKVALPMIMNSTTMQNVVNINNVNCSGQQLTTPIGSNLLNYNMTKVNLPTTTVHSIPAQSILYSNSQFIRQQQNKWQAPIRRILAVNNDSTIQNVKTQTSSTLKDISYMQSVASINSKLSVKDCMETSDESSSDMSLELKIKKAKLKKLRTCLRKKFAQVKSLQQRIRRRNKQLSMVKGNVRPAKLSEE